MVDYFKLPANYTLPDVEPEEEQEAPQPEVAIVWNVSKDQRIPRVWNSAFLSGSP